jgi:hypothetical protein
MYGQGQQQRGASVLGDGARFERVPSGTRGLTGKAAKKFSETIGHSEFSAEIFALCAVNGFGPVTQEKTLAVAVSLIQALSDQYDSGSMSEAAVNGKRLMDAIEPLIGIYEIPRA